MKKMMVILLVICMTVGLTGCISYAVQYRCMGTAEQIAQIAVFDLRTEMTDKIDETLVPMGYVKADAYAAFVEELESFPFVDQMLLILVPSDPSFTYGGYVVRIAYEDGSYELIGNAGFQSKHSGGKYVGGSHYGCDDDRWNQFVLKYMDPVR